jgi:hypothetical protein
MHTILSRFLAAGLLPIGEDDEKLKLLAAASDDLAGRVNANPLLTHRLTLAGLDSRISNTDPALKVGEEAVLNKWHTITNKVGPTPVQVYRAVILRALEVVGSAKPPVAQAIALIARNEPALHLADSERDAVTPMLRQFEASASTDLVQKWVAAGDVVLPKLVGKVKKPQLSKEELTAALARAAGPNDKAKAALSNANPNWPDAGQPWSHEFVARASDAIYNAIQTASKAFVDELQEGVRDSLQHLSRNIEQMAIRDAKSELLWIRASMYSPSAAASYRDLSPTDLIIHAALDVSQAVSHNAPPSVEFFLRDLVGPLQKKRFRLGEVLRAISAKISVSPEAQTFLSDPLPPNGRRAWLDLAIRLSSGISFEQQAGVPEDYEDHAGEFAVRFYRELQIRKLLSSTE